MLNYCRRLAAARKSLEYREVFTYGETVPVYEDTEGVMAYYRVYKEKRVLAAADVGQEAVKLWFWSVFRRVVIAVKPGGCEKMECFYLHFSQPLFCASQLKETSALSADSSTRCTVFPTTPKFR